MSRNAVELLKRLFLRRVQSPGFDRIYKNMRIVSGGNGNVCFELDVTPDLLNIYKSLHGGVTATLVDVASAHAFSTAVNEHESLGEDIENKNLGVSVDLNVSYLKPVFENETILIKATTLKCGKTIAVGSVDIINKETGDLIAQGRHTKFMGGK